MKSPPTRGSERSERGVYGFWTIRRIVAKPVEVLHHLYVSEPHDADSSCLQVRRPSVVVALGTLCVVTVTVQFDDQSVRRTIEIGDVGSERLLTGEFLRQGPAAAIVTAGSGCGDKG